MTTEYDNKVRALRKVWYEAGFGPLGDIPEGWHEIPEATRNKWRAQYLAARDFFKETA